MLNRVYDVDWICEYNMAWYPFDTQSCVMTFEVSAQCPVFAFEYPPFWHPGTLGTSFPKNNPEKCFVPLKIKKMTIKSLPQTIQVSHYTPSPPQTDELFFTKVLPSDRGQHGRVRGTLGLRT